MAKEFVVIATIQTRADWSSESLEKLLATRLVTGFAPTPTIERVFSVDVFDILAKTEDEVERMRRRRCGFEIESIAASPQETE